MTPLSNRKTYYLFIYFVLALVLGAQAKKDKKHLSNNYKINIVNSLSKRCWQLREIETDSSLNLGLKALQLATDINYRKGITQNSNYVGVLYGHYLYEYHKAIPYFHTALEVSLIEADSIELAYAYNNLSYIYLKVGNTPLALKYGRYALDVFKKLDDKVGLAYAYHGLGDIYKNKKDLSKALGYYKLATNIRNKVSPIARRGSILFNVGKTFELAGQLDSAMNYYNKALVELDISKKSRYGSVCMNGIANIHCANGQYEAALEHYKIALEWDEFRKHNFGIIDNYIGMAMVYAHQNNHQEGINTLNKALNLANSPSSAAKQITVYKSFIKFYTILGDFENASKYFNIFLERYDNILSNQQIEIVKELEKNFAINQKLEQTEKELKTDEVLRGRLIIIIILMIIVILILIIQYRSYKKMSTQLSEINKTKNKLFSVISHDMKSPFNSLMGFSELLVTALEKKEYKEASEYADIIHKGSSEGYELIIKLLNWSMAQNGKILFNPEMVDFNEFFPKIEQHFFDSVKNTKVKLLFKNDLPDKVYADPHILNIILNNLITNAFKYTPKEGSITVTGFQLHSHFIIQVKDSGIGMSTSVIDNLFDTKNFIESKAGLREEKGSGLGLSIVQELLEVHKGSMQINSEEGKGTTIDLKFSLKIN